MTLPTFQVDALRGRWDKVLNEPSDVIEHLPTFAQTVKELDARKVIEVGVRYGVSTIAWLYALQPGIGTGGHLWAVDVSFPIPAPGETINLLDPQGGLTSLPHWNFILGDGKSSHVLAMLPDDADILFIDTNHVYEEVLEELEFLVPLVRKGGRVLMHDTAIEDTANRGERPMTPYPVLTAMKEYCEAKGLKWSNVENCNGLGTIYV